MKITKPILFLLNPNFKDAAIASDKLYFCPDCAFVEGILGYYPRLRKELDIIYVDFQRPRKEITELIGENNQSCPCLILDHELINQEPDFKHYENFLFSNDTKIIAKYLSEKFGIGILHP